MPSLKLWMGRMLTQECPSNEARVFGQSWQDHNIQSVRYAKAQLSAALQRDPPCQACILEAQRMAVRDVDFEFTKVGLSRTSSRSLHVWTPITFSP